MLIIIVIITIIVFREELGFGVRFDKFRSVYPVAIKLYFGLTCILQGSSLLLFC